MTTKLLEKFFNLVFSNKVEVDEENLQVKEHTINDSPLLLTFRLTQFIGLQPIIIRKINFKTYYVTVSPVIYCINILILAIINGIFFYALFLSVFMPKGSSRGIIAYSSYDETNDLLIAIAITPLSIVSIYSTLYGCVRVRCILHCLERIKKIKQNINKLPYDRIADRRKKYCLILFATFWPPFVECIGTWLSGFDGLSTWMCHILTIMVVLLEIQFLLLVESLNSLFHAINRKLSEVLSQQNFNYTTKSRRAKIALQIHHLMIYFMESCNILRKINSNESFLLLCHVVIFPLQILIRLYYLFYSIRNIAEDPFPPTLVICEAINCFYHIYRTTFIIQPCHQTQEEVTETKLLVAELMCHIQSKDDPLFESVNTFYKQLILNNYSFTAMGICDIGRHLLSTIVGLSITFVMVIQF